MESDDDFVKDDDISRSGFAPLDKMVSYILGSSNNGSRQRSHKILRGNKASSISDRNDTSVNFSDIVWTGNGPKMLSQLQNVSENSKISNSSNKHESHNNFTLLQALNMKLKEKFGDRLSVSRKESAKEDLFTGRHANLTLRRNHTMTCSSFKRNPTLQTYTAFVYRTDANADIDLQQIPNKIYKRKTNANKNFNEHKGYTDDNEYPFPEHFDACMIRRKDVNVTNRAAFRDETLKSRNRRHNSTWKEETINNVAVVATEVFHDIDCATSVTGLSGSIPPRPETPSKVNRRDFRNDMRGDIQSFIRQFYEINDDGYRIYKIDKPSDMKKQDFITSYLEQSELKLNNSSMLNPMYVIRVNGLTEDNYTQPGVQVPKKNELIRLRNSSTTDDTYGKRLTILVYDENKRLQNRFVANVTGNSKIVIVPDNLFSTLKNVNLDLNKTKYIGGILNDSHVLPQPMTTVPAFDSPEIFANAVRKICPERELEGSTVSSSIQISPFANSQPKDDWLRYVFFKDASNSVSNTRLSAPPRCKAFTDDRSPIWEMKMSTAKTESDRNKSDEFNMWKTLFSAQSVPEFNNSVVGLANNSHSSNLVGFISTAAMNFPSVVLRSVVAAQTNRVSTITAKSENRTDKSITAEDYRLLNHIIEKIEKEQVTTVRSEQQTVPSVCPANYSESLGPNTTRMTNSTIDFTNYMSPEQNRTNETTVSSFDFLDTRPISVTCSKNVTSPEQNHTLPDTTASRIYHSDSKQISPTCCLKEVMLKVLDYESPDNLNSTGNGNATNNTNFGRVRLLKAYLPLYELNVTSKTKATTSNVTEQTIMITNVVSNGGYKVNLTNEATLVPFVDNKTDGSISEAEPNSTIGFKIKSKPLHSHNTTFFNIFTLMAVIPTESGLNQDLFTPVYKRQMIPIENTTASSGSTAVSRPGLNASTPVGTSGYGNRSATNARRGSFLYPDNENVVHAILYEYGNVTILQGLKKTSKEIFVNSSSVASPVLNITSSVRFHSSTETISYNKTVTTIVGNVSRDLYGFTNDSSVYVINSTKLPNAFTEMQRKKVPAPPSRSKSVDMDNDDYDDDDNFGANVFDDDKTLVKRSHLPNEAKISRQDPSVLRDGKKIRTERLIKTEDNVLVDGQIAYDEFDLKYFGSPCTPYSGTALGKILTSKAVFLDVDDALGSINYSVDSTTLYDFLIMDHGGAGTTIQPQAHAQTQVHLPSPASKLNNVTKTTRRAKLIKNATTRAPLVRNVTVSKKNYRLSLFNNSKKAEKHLKKLNNAKRYNISTKRFDNILQQIEKVSFLKRARLFSDKNRHNNNNNKSDTDMSDLIRYVTGNTQEDYLKRQCEANETDTRCVCSFKDFVKTLDSYGKSYRSDNNISDAYRNSICTHYKPITKRFVITNEIRPRIITRSNLNISDTKMMDEPDFINYYKSNFTSVPNKVESRSVANTVNRNRGSAS